MRLSSIIDAKQMALAKEDIALAKAIWALKAQFPRRADILHTVGHSIQAMGTEHWNKALRQPTVDPGDTTTKD